MEEGKLWSECVRWGRGKLAMLLGETLIRLFKLDDMENAVPILTDAEVTPKMFSFQSRIAPASGIVEYIFNLVRKTCPSEEALIASMSYISRISKMVPRFPITILTIHRLVLVAIMISSKFHDDHSNKLSVYAKWGGVEARDLANLEVDLLQLLNFDVAVSSDQWTNLYRELIIDNPVSPLHKPSITKTPSATDMRPQFDGSEKILNSKEQGLKKI